MLIGVFLLVYGHVISLSFESIILSGITRNLNKSDMKFNIYVMSVIHVSI